MNRLLPLLFKNERDAALLSFIERGDRAYLSRNGVVVPVPRTLDTAPDAVSNKTARNIERSERFIIAQSAPPADTTIDVIIIDPGHGGRDPGAIGYSDIREKDLVLDAAILLRDALTRALSPRTKVVLTRGEDAFMSLEERSLYANNAVGIGTKEQKNGLFISVHANASFNRSSRGFEVYFVSAEESSEAARAVASFENSVAVDFERNRYTYTNYAEGIYYKMIIEQYQKESSMMSGFVEEEISLSVKDVVKRTKPVQSALFYVLKGVLMPAVLVEIGFITNPVEAKLLSSKEYQEQMMQAVAAGVVRYVRLFEKTKGFTQ
ncbi:MAG: N-acetylmuramoyl-L-alanine amidase [Spirochaetes bacterium]|nr:N-acetylmuramoyl-L-alanine amidase [Spirochaetota bacterium]